MKNDCRLCYLEQKIKELVGELKEKNCLCQDFEFLTQAEQEAKMKDFVDGFNHSS